MKYLLYSPTIGFWRSFDYLEPAQKELDYSNAVSNRMDGNNNDSQIVYKTENGIFVDEECTTKLKIDDSEGYFRQKILELKADQILKKDTVLREQLLEFVRLVATPARNDGTFNYCREALQKKAAALIKELVEN